MCSYGPRGPEYIGRTWHPPPDSTEDSDQARQRSPDPSQSGPLAPLHGPTDSRGQEQGVPRQPQARADRAGDRHPRGGPEVERRAAAFRAELRASGEAGEALVRRMAVASVWMDRAVEQEEAAIAANVARAIEEFEAPEGLDEATVDRLRAQTARLALFDPSKEATLARKYEAAAERAFFRSLQELQRLRREREASPEAPPARPGPRPRRRVRLCPSRPSPRSWPAGLASRPEPRPRARRSGSSRRETRQFGTALTSRSRSAGPADRPIRPPIAIPKPTAEAANAPDARGVDSPSDGTARLRVGRLSLPWPRTGRTTRGRRPPCRTAGNPR